MGHPVSEVPRSTQRYPVWPPGIVGSISHDLEFVAAAIGLSSQVTGIGIDIEPGERLSPDIGAIVASADESLAFCDMAFYAKAVFSIKEDVFKAAYPNDGIFLEFRDVAVDRARSIARTSYGKSIHWRLHMGASVLAVAWY
jgi:4'-phosphopantetheinyl transferase EntD